MFVHDYKISDPTVSVGTNALPADDLPKGRVSMFITHAGSVAQFGPEVMKDMKVVPFPQVNPDKPVTSGLRLCGRDESPPLRGEAKAGA